MSKEINCYIYTVRHVCIACVVHANETVSANEIAHASVQSCALLFLMYTIWNYEERVEEDDVNATE